MTEQEELVHLRHTVATKDILLAELSERFTFLENKWRGSQKEMIQERHSLDVKVQKACLSRQRIDRAQIDKLKDDLRETKKLSIAEGQRWRKVVDWLQPAWVLAYSSPIPNDPIRSLRLTGGWLERAEQAIFRFLVP